MCNIGTLVDVWRRCSRAGLDESSRTSSGLAVRRTHHPELGAFAVRWLIVTLALLFCGDVLAARVASPLQDLQEGSDAVRSAKDPALVAMVKLDHGMVAGTFCPAATPCYIPCDKGLLGSLGIAVPKGVSGKDRCPKSSREGGWSHHVAAGDGRGYGIDDPNMLYPWLMESRFFQLLPRATVRLHRWDDAFSILRPLELYQV